MENAPPDGFFRPPLAGHSFNVFVNLYITSSYYSGNTFQLFLNNVADYVANSSDFYTTYRLYTTLNQSSNFPPFFEILVAYNGTDKNAFQTAILNTTSAWEDVPLYNCSPSYPSPQNGTLYRRLLTMIDTERLQRTSINVFTQFPVDPDYQNDWDYETLEQRAVAYGVAVSVLFDDPVKTFASVI